MIHELHADAHYTDLGGFFNTALKRLQLNDKWKNTGVNATIGLREHPWLNMHCRAYRPSKARYKVDTINIYCSYFGWNLWGVKLKGFISQEQQSLSDERDLTKSGVAWAHTDQIPWASVGKGIQEKVLSRDSETGGYTRLLRFDKGAETVEASVHDFWEEVFILQGTLTDRVEGTTIGEGFYTCRKPGTRHGPFVSATGCLAIEFTYF